MNSNTLLLTANVGRAPWSFRTKLELVAELVEWCVILFQNCFHRPVMVIADGAYAKRPFLSRVKKTGVHRGQPPVEGRRTVRSSPAFRKTPKRTTAYLREQQTIPKSTGQSPPRLDTDPHEAVWPRANRSLQDIPGHVSPGWRSDPRDDCEATLEAVADRSAIEQNFHDVKAVYGSGQQQVRNVWCNVACWNLCLWLHSLVVASLQHDPQATRRTTMGRALTQALSHRSPQNPQKTRAARIIFQVSPPSAIETNNAVPVQGTARLAT